MASTFRGSDSSLEAILQSDFAEFDFFQAVRLIHFQALKTAAIGRAGLQLPVGKDQDPLRECLRFRASVSFAFSPAEISAIAIRRDDGTAYPKTYEMLTTFMGFVGAQGVLPQHYTQLVLRNRREPDNALRTFLDLFHHRIISVYFRAWQRSRVQFQWEECRLHNEAKEDRFTQSMFSLIGFGNGALQDSSLVSSAIRGRLQSTDDNRQSTDGRFPSIDQVLLYYSGIFSHRPRNAVSLQRLLSTLFSIPVEVRQRQGQWVHLQPRDQTRMPGSDVSAANSNARLGDSAMAGNRVWSIESKIRIVAGPVQLKEFNQFCPGQPAFMMLSQIIRLWVGPDFDVDLQLILLQKEVPRTRLDEQAKSRFLGWTSWIGNRPADRNSRDAVFQLQGEP